MNPFHGIWYRFFGGWFVFAAVRLITQIPVSALCTQTTAQLTELTNDLPPSVWSPQYPHSLMRCTSNQKTTPPKKSEMMKAFSVAQSVERWTGREGMLLLPPTPPLVQSSGPLLGLQALSLSTLLPSSFLTLLLAQLLFPLATLFSLPLTHSLSGSSVSPRGLIYGCGATET